MRVLCFAKLMLLIYTACFAQNKATIWVGGFHGGIDFNESIAVAFFRPDDNSFWIWRTSSSICDSIGNLLFYTNGFRVFNRNFEIMQNGDSLDIGDYLLWGLDLSPTPDGAVIIPVPNNASFINLPP